MLRCNVSVVWVCELDLSHIIGGVVCICLSGSIHLRKYFMCFQEMYKVHVRSLMLRCNLCVAFLPSVHWAVPVHHLLQLSAGHRGAHRQRPGQVSCLRFTVTPSPSGRSSRKIFFFRINFVCWLLFSVCFSPILLHWHVKDPGHSARSAGGRFHPWPNEVRVGWLLQA